MAGNEVVINVRAEGVEQTSAGLKGLAASITGTALGFGLFTVAKEAMDQVRGAIGGAMDSAQAFNLVQAQTNAVLASTQGAAGISAGAVRDLSASLEQMSGIDEVAIQSAENLLLTFTNIGKDVFPQATEAIVNMSVALGTDMNGAAIQVGKALQDPVNGITALRRVGVSFTESQQELIKSMVEGGRGAEAQALILAELQKEFGGSAKAAEDARGGINRAKDAMDDTARDLAQGLLAALTRLKAAFYEGVGAALQHKAVLGGLAALLGGVVIGAVIAFVSTIGLIPVAMAAALFALGAGFTWLYDNFDRIRGAWANLWDGLPGPVQGFLNGLVSAVKFMADILLSPINLAIKGWNLLDSIMGGKRQLGTVQAMATDAFEWARGAAGDAIGKAKGALSDAFTPFDLGKGTIPQGGGIDFGGDAGGSGAKSAMQSVMDNIAETLNDQLADAFFKGGREQVEIVKQSQAEMMARVRTTAIEMMQALGIDFPDAMQRAFTSINDAQQELADVTAQIQRDLLDQQIQAFLEGGESQLAIIRESQLNAQSEIQNTAIRIVAMFGIDMPNALKMAEQSWLDTASAMQEARKSATALAQQLWAAFPGVSGAQQGRFAMLASAITSGGDVQAALDAANAEARSRNPELLTQTNVTVNMGVVGDPVAAGQAVASLITQASQANGPMIPSSAVSP